MYSENVCLWYDESRIEQDRYNLACDARDAYREFRKLYDTIENYDLTDEQFDKLPDDTFPEDWQLDDMDCDSLAILVAETDESINILQNILAEVTNH